jgi:DNA-binding CsgD family transcriptional regulator
MKSKPAEFWWMLAVIAITAWHVRSFLATKDAMLASWVIGLVLGGCNFLFASRFFSARARVPAFVALCIGAAYSVSMQYAYFDAKDIAQNAITYDLLGRNVNALVLAVWAPTFEILLGWLYSAMTAGHTDQAVTGPSRWSAVADALARRAVATLQPPAPQIVQAELQPVALEIQHESLSENAVQARNMRANGMKIGDIASALQVSERTVYNLLKAVKQPKIHTNGHSMAVQP